MTPGRMGGSAERPARFFCDAAEFRSWLEVNHDSATELWMGLHKKHVADRGLTWEQAVPEALCFGWIDSRIERIDADAIRQRWTPRRAGSAWSSVNIALVERLTADGLMRPPGVAAYEGRKPEQSGVYAYEQGEAVLPPAYQAQVDADPRAARFLGAATPSYLKIAANWVSGAKQEATREKRLAQFIADSSAGRLIPSQRYGDEPKWAGRAREALDAAPD